MERFMEAGELIRRCLAGDRRAMDSFVGQFAEVIHQAVRATLWAADRTLAQEAEDIAEEVLVGLLKDGCRALRAYDPGRDLRAWVYTVARGRCIDEVRRLMRRRRMRPMGEEVEARLEAPSEATADPELAARVQAAIDELPDRQRLAVRMFFFDGRKYKEIAQAVGITVSEVASYIHRAKEKLAQALREES